jgi:hypothetical protein
MAAGKEAREEVPFAGPKLLTAEAAENGREERKEDHELRVNAQSIFGKWLTLVSK